MQWDHFESGNPQVLAVLLTQRKSGRSAADTCTEQGRWQVLECNLGLERLHTVVRSREQRLADMACGELEGDGCFQQGGQVVLAHHRRYLRGPFTSLQGRSDGLRVSTLRPGRRGRFCAVAETSPSSMMLNSNPVNQVSSGTWGSSG